MRRATCSGSVTKAPPVTIFTTGSVIPGGGEGQVGTVTSPGSGCVGVELLGGILEVGGVEWGVGGGVEGGVYIL